MIRSWRAGSNATTPPPAEAATPVLQSAFLRLASRVAR
jgi:hypothetical protein